MSTRTSSESSYNELVRCDKEVPAFEDKHRDYNKLWYDFLKNNNAYCVDPDVSYKF
jgi:hypothetical protein